MKKQFLKIIFFTAVILAFGACNDPIFYNISMEEKILEPRIKGSPTNFIEFNDDMYVASGTKVYWYKSNAETGRGNWYERAIPAISNILALAATTDKLYALCAESSGKRVLKVSDNGNVWDNAQGLKLKRDETINVIYAASDQLFIGAGNIGSYVIYLYDGDSTILANTKDEMLNGAAYHDGFYYLSAKNLITNDAGGIYVIAEGDLFSGTAATVGNGSFVGIINTNLGSNPVKAINRDGAVFNVTSDSISSTGIKMDSSRLATGALALWEKNGNLLLLAGRQDVLGTTVTSGYSHGYLEVGLNENGDITGSFVEPGNNDISTVNNGDNGRYRSTIGRYHVNYIFQAGDGTLFASTQKNGVWSYRIRSNGEVLWNTED